MCASKLTKKRGKARVFLLLLLLLLSEIAMNGASQPSEAPFIFRNFGETLLNADNVIIGSKYGKLLLHTFYQKVLLLVARTLVELWKMPFILKVRNISKYKVGKWEISGVLSTAAIAFLKT